MDGGDYDASGRIDANARGYLGGRGWHEQGGHWAMCMVLLMAPAAAMAALATVVEGRASNPVYGEHDHLGSESLGSGGGNWSGNWGGDGGGLIRINAVKYTPEWSDLGKRR